MLTPFFLSLSSHSPLGLSLSPAEFAIVKSTFSNTAKREYYGRVIFVLPPPRTSLVVSVLFYISIHDTRTHHYTLLNLACLENTWKMSLLEGGCPMSITIHTSPNWINRSIVVQSRSHLWVSVPRRRKLPRIFFYFLRPLFLPFAAPPCICCGRTISQQRYPLSINRCKRAATRPYQPPGLIKSNFFFTGQLRSAVVSPCFRIITFCLPSLTTRLRSRANCHTALPSSGTILSITYTHRQSGKYFFFK